MPSNEYYDSTGYPSNKAAGSSASMRAELDSIEDGFKKLPALAGHASEIVAVNSGGTALESLTAAEVRALLDVYSRAESPTIPVGCVVAFIGGYFTNGANAGFTSTLGNDAATINALLNPSNFYVCNGAVLNLPGSTIFNGAGRYLPNISDARFLMGSTGAGATGGSTSSAHTHTTGSFALEIQHLPSHNHTFSSCEPDPVPGGTSANNVQPGGTPDYTLPTSYVGGGVAHNHGDTGAASATENRPLFLACHYIMKAA